MARGSLRRILGWPVRRVLDRRVEWILAALDERVGSGPQRPNLHYRLDRIEAELGHAHRAIAESLLDRRLASLAQAEDATLPGDTARFLNWAEGHEGPAARAGLWFNPPVPVEYSENAVGVLSVNERIVEQPYVFGRLARLPRPSRILDVGGSESTVGLSLATLGHEVHVVDPRGYKLAHPMLWQHPVALGQLSSELRFDAAVALSSIEHFGLGAYGLPVSASADAAALRDIRERLEPGGLLVLTVPCGPVSTVDDFQRVYAIDDLRELLAGWEVDEISVVWRRDAFTWVPDEASDVGVALVTARRPR